jgi:putative DNA primase/helicase
LGTATSFQPAQRASHLRCHLSVRQTLQRFGGPDEAIAFTNGVLDLEARKLLPHHPERFNLHSLPFAYDPDADCPLWLEFLKSILPSPEEQDAVLFLREWFGYTVSGRTDLEKMASLIGAKRCGKGTLAKVLAAMIGPEFVAGPQLSDLAGTFGKEALIGKQLAIMGDVRWTGKASNEAVPVLLGITGRDHGTVHRKNRSAWNGSLGVRFLVMSNDEPKFTDASGALASRMIHVEFQQTFYGKEKTGLAEQLKAELPGILNWALKGLDRLNENGKFTVPVSSVGIERNIKRTSAPADAFIEDRCKLVEGEMTSLADLYIEWQKWCRSTGRPEAMMNDDSLSAALRSSLRGRKEKVFTDRKQVDGVRTTWFRGLKLTPSKDPQWLAGDQS